MIYFVWQLTHLIKWSLICPCESSSCMHSFIFLCFIYNIRFKIIVGELSASTWALIELYFSGPSFFISNHATVKWVMGLSPSMRIVLWIYALCELRAFNSHNRNLRDLFVGSWCVYKVLGILKCNDYSLMESDIHHAWKQK